MAIGIQGMVNRLLGSVFFLISLGCNTLLSANEYCPEGASFCDSFESSNLSATSPKGFRWTDSAWVTVVSETHEVYWNQQAVNWPKASARSFPGVDWSAQTGNHSLRFRYIAGESMSEQRFLINDPHKELWIRYWLHVPSNFKHNNKNPSNNKLLAIWMDDYEGRGDGSTVAWEFWSDGNSGSRLAVHYSKGRNTYMGSHQQHFSFIKYPDDQGRWMQIVVRLKAPTTSSSNDGLIELYRRWESESEFTLYHQLENAEFKYPTNGPQGWNGGYFMGWSNPGYEQNTEWIMDDVVFSRTSLLDIGDSASPPRPPSLEILR